MLNYTTQLTYSVTIPEVQYVVRPILRISYVMFALFE